MSISLTLYVVANVSISRINQAKTNVADLKETIINEDSSEEKMPKCKGYGARLGICENNAVQKYLQKGRPKRVKNGLACCAKCERLRGEYRRTKK